MNPMTPQQQAIGVTILFSAIGVLADYYLKIASGKPFPWNSWQFILGLSLYASTAFGWLFVMQHLKLAAVGILYTSSMLVMLAVVGYFGFGEKLSIREWIGFALALASVVLLVRDH
jgi:small multidrug resistance pump